jgi:hypothetical protein
MARRNPGDNVAAGERDLRKLLEAAVSDLPDEEGQEGLPEADAEAADEEWHEAA